MSLQHVGGAGVRAAQTRLMQPPHYDLTLHHPRKPHSPHPPLAAPARPGHTDHSRVRPGPPLPPLARCLSPVQTWG